MGASRRGLAGDAGSEQSRGILGFSESEQARRSAAIADKNRAYRISIASSGRSWRRRGLSRYGEADKHALIRRATFDLIGLPPTPEEVDAFVNDSSPDAFRKVVDRLLASPHYGERWGRYWLDLARYSDGDLGASKDTPFPNAYRYRDWVIQAFNDDMPYDMFVKAQIAGDLMPAMNARSCFRGSDSMRLGPG